MSNVSDEVKISTSIYNIKYIYTVCRTCWTNDFFLLVAVRKVATGYKLVTQGHAVVAEGWQLFEEAVEEAGPSDLPQPSEATKGEDNPNPDTTTPTNIGQWKLEICHPLLHLSK